MAQVVLRRFYVLIPLIAVSVLLAVVYGNSVKPTYQYSASVLLVSPTPPATSNNQSAVPVPFQNPWFQISKNLEPVATLVVSGMSAPGASRGVAPGNGVNVAYSTGSNTSIPSVTVTTSSANQRAAAASLSPALQALQANLKTWQKQNGATDNALVTTLPVPGGASQSVLYPGKTRGEAAIVAIGIVLSLILTFIVEAISVRRRRRLVSRTNGLPAATHARTLGRSEDQTEPVTAEF